MIPFGFGLSKDEDYDKEEDFTHGIAYYDAAERSDPLLCKDYITDMFQNMYEAEVRVMHLSIVNIELQLFRLTNLSIWHQLDTNSSSTLHVRTIRYQRQNACNPHRLAGRSPPKIPSQSQYTLLMCEHNRQVLHESRCKKK